MGRASRAELWPAPVPTPVAGASLHWETASAQRYVISGEELEVSAGDVHAA